MGVLPVQDVKPSFTTEDTKNLSHLASDQFFLSKLVLCVYTYKLQLYYVYIVKNMNRTKTDLDVTLNHHSTLASVWCFKIYGQISAAVIAIWYLLDASWIGEGYPLEFEKYTTKEQTRPRSV